MSAKTIGVLAGMGPRSTAPFVDLLVTECQRQYGATANPDFPHMLIYSLPTPFYVDRPSDLKEVIRVIQSGLQRLESAGASFITMPCNSAHAFFPSLASSVKIPLLNMVEESVQAFDGYERIALCATPTTVASGLYQQAIAMAGKQWLPNDPAQPVVTGLINGIIAGEDRGRLRQQWQDVVSMAVDCGADALLIACTELNALGELSDDRIGLPDATAALARASIRKYLEISKAVEAAS